MILPCSLVVCDCPIQPGDIVLGADGVRFKYIGDLVAFVDKMRGQEINLSVKREGRLLTIPVSPRMTFPEDEGSLGIRISYEGVRNDPLYYSLPTAIVKGFRSAVEQSWRILSSPFVVLKQGIVKQATEFERPTGFTENGLIYVGIGESGTALYSIFRFLGVLSAGVIIPITAVTLISLLPLPGWDTWRIIALLFRSS